MKGFLIIFAVLSAVTLLWFAVSVQLDRRHQRRAEERWGKLR